MPVTDYNDKKFLHRLQPKAAAARKVTLSNLESVFIMTRLSRLFASKAVATMTVVAGMLVSTFVSSVATAESLETRLEIEQCMRNLVLSAEPEDTIASIRAVCTRQVKKDGGVESSRTDLPESRDTALDRRRQAESATQLNPFVITAHRPSYVMPITYYTNPNSEPLDYEPSRFETKFQLSFKMPLWANMFDSNASLYFAYTGQSYWQLFKEENSRPFRETDHEPELFVNFDLDMSAWDIELSAVQVGVVHQSNGRDIPQSRSWNRFFVSMQLAWQNVYVQFKPWIRLQEDAREDPNEPDGDDNPNIERFVGQAELVAAWRMENHTVSAVWRNNLRADNRGSIELGYSFPINDRLRGYVQYFNGYGESLLDFDQHTNRIGVGILLTDWL